ncbi:MAG: hypothetical protein MJ072_03255, partial [Clostridia bacterium]|nr:hypothetical protein [Clostridia bacterium]
YVRKEEHISDLHKKWDTEIIEHSLDVLNSDIKTVDKLREILTYVFVNVKDDEIFAYRFYFFVTEIFRRNERVEFFSEAEKKMIIEHSSKKVSRISSLPKIVNDLFVKGVEEGVIKDDRPVKEYFKLLMDSIVGVTMHIILTPKERRNEIKIPDVDLILSVFINKEALTN